jgi:hypothetical protein
MPVSTTSPRNAQSSGCLTLFGLMFAIPGVAVGISTLRKLLAGRTDAKQIVLGFTMALMFAGAGIGLMVWGRVSARLAAKNRETMARDPEKPWLWRDDWAQGYAKAEWKSNAAIMSVIGAAFLLFSVPMLMNLPAALLREHPFQTALVLFFPVVGVLLLGQSALSTLRARKFRDTRLRLSSVPSATGGKLQGRVEAGFVFPPEAAVDLTLSCVRSYVSGSGDDRTRWEKILWQERNTGAASTDGQATYIAVEFALPYDAQGTDVRNSDDEILWKLIASSKLPGLDFNATFPVPVFKTAGGDPALTTAALEAHDEARLAGAQPAGSKIVTRAARSGGYLFYFGAARNKRAAAIFSLFGAVFLGSGIFFGVAGGQAFGWIVGLIPIALAGGIGLLLLMFSFWLWLGTTTIEVVNRELHIRSGCLGISRSRVIPASTIQEFQLDPSVQAGQDILYDLQLKLASGRSAVAAGGLEKQEAEWLRAELKKDLGLH